MLLPLIVLLLTFDVCLFIFIVKILKFLSSKTNTNLLKDALKIALDPTKQYLLFLPLQNTPADRASFLIEKLNTRLKEQGINCVTVMLDNPQDIRIIETPAHDPETARDT